LSIARKLEKYEANDYTNDKVKEKFVFAVMIKLGITCRKISFDQRNFFSCLKRCSLQVSLSFEFCVAYLPANLKKKNINKNTKMENRMQTFFTETRDISIIYK
jgi:hypothetical protein